MLKRRAHQKPVTLKPGTKDAVSKINKALTAKVNNPKVRIFIGKVKIINIGFIKAFKTPKTSATSKAEIKLATATPGKTYAAARTERAIIIQFVKTSVICLL